MFSPVLVSTIWLSAYNRVSLVGREGCVLPSFQFIQSLWSRARQIPPNENILVFKFVYSLESGTSCFGFCKDFLK